MPVAKRDYEWSGGDYSSPGEFGLHQPARRAQLPVKGKPPTVGERRHSSGAIAAICEDPLLARIQVLTELPVEERLNWVLDVRAQLILHRRTLALEASGPTSMFDKIAREASMEILHARLEWLDKLYEQILVEHGSMDQGQS